MSIFIDPRKIKEILNFVPRDEMLIDLGGLGISQILIEANQIRDHVGIRATLNALIGLMKQYDTFFAPVRPFNEFAGAKVGMRAEIERQVKKLADEIQAYNDKKENSLQEKHKFLLARRDFWITIGVALLVACIPALFSQCESKSKYEALEERVQKLEPKKVDGPTIQEPTKSK